MQPTASAPSFTGKGESSARFEKEAELWRQIITSDATKRGPALVLQIAPRAKEICCGRGNAKLISADGAKETLDASKSSKAPDALDAMRPGVVKVLRGRKAAEIVGGSV